MKFFYLFLLVLIFIVAGCTQNIQPIEQSIPTLQECQIYADSFKQECPSPHPVECPQQKCDCPETESDCPSIGYDFSRMYQPTNLHFQCDDGSEPFTWNNCKYEDGEQPPMLANELIRIDEVKDIMLILEQQQNFCIKQWKEGKYCRISFPSGDEEIRRFVECSQPGVGCAAS